MHDAVEALVRDGDTVAIEGFTHLICFAAGHEIIRQGRRDLTLCRLTPDVIYDQMIGAGVASKLVFSWLALTLATTSGSRAQSTVSNPARAQTWASAVPQAPPPSTAIFRSFFT